MLLTLLFRQRAPTHAAWRPALTPSPAQLRRLGNHFRGLGDCGTLGAVDVKHPPSPPLLPPPASTATLSILASTMTIRGVRLPVGAIIGIVAGGAAFLAILATVLVYLRRYVRKQYARRDPLVHKWEQHQSDSSSGFDQASAATTSIRVSSVKASSIKLMDKNTTDSTSEVVDNAEESNVEEGEQEDNASMDARHGSV